jgi:hypothetical protein
MILFDKRFVLPERFIFVSRRRQGLESNTSQACVQTGQSHALLLFLGVISPVFKTVIKNRPGIATGQFKSKFI